MNVRLSGLLLSAMFVAAAGCSSGGGGSFATDAGDSVLIESATAFTVAQAGGGLAGPSTPPGSHCSPGIWSYTVHLDTSKFDWDRCAFSGSDINDPASYTQSTGSRVLSAAELEAARAAARMVHVSSETACGADKPTVSLTVFSPAGSRVYADDFYACAKLAEVYVISAEIDALTAQLRALDQ